MTDQADELQRRLRAFREELLDEKLYDSEFTPNPHRPGERLRELVELGPAAEPALVELSRSADHDARFWAVMGFQQLGASCGPEGLAALETLTRDQASSEFAIDALEALAPMPVTYAAAVRPTSCRSCSS